MVPARGSPIWAAAAATLLLAATIEAARVRRITPSHVGFAGGEIAILGNDFAEDQYSQFQPELGNIVNFVNDWDTVPCKVNVYKTSKSRIICTVGPLRADRGLGNRYTLRLTVDGQPVSSGWAIQYHDGYTPHVESVEPAAGPPGSLVTITGRFFTDRYSIDTNTASDLQNTGLGIAWIRVGSGDCDPVDPSTGELYGLTAASITCRTAASYAGPLSVQLLVTGRGLSAVKDRRRQISAQDTTYDFLSVPVVTDVQPTSLAAQGGAVVTVDGVGFDPQPGATNVTVGGAECRVLTATSTQLTCAAPAEQATSAEKQGGSGVWYEVWLDAEVTDLGDLSTLTPDSDGYNSETLLGALVTNNSFGQGAAAGDKFVGRMSGWLRSPRLGQFVLTLRSDGAAQLWLGTAPDSMEESPAAETAGNFNSVQKSAAINMTDGQLVYFEATHKEGAGGYRLQVGLIDYNSPVTRDQARAATPDTQVLYIKGQLRQEQQVLTFQDVPEQAMNAVELEFNGVLSQTPVNAATATEDTWRSAVLDMFSAQCQYSDVDQAWLRTYGDLPSSSEMGRETGVRKNETIEPWCGAWSLYKPWGGIWTTTNSREYVQLARHRWLCLAHWGRITGHVRVLLQFRGEGNQLVHRWKQFDAELPSTQSWTYSCVDIVDKLDGEISLPATLRDVRLPFNWNEDVYFDDVSFSAQEKTVSRRPAARHGTDPLFVRDVRVTTSADPLTVAVTMKVAGCASELPLIRLAGTNGTQVADTSGLNELVMAADDWGQASVKNMRNVSASPAPAGTWDIMFNGQTVEGVPTNLTSEGMTLLLATRLSLPGVVVTRHGECERYHWTVQFRHHGGRQPLIAVNGSNVLFDGDNLQVGVWKDPNNGDGRVTHEFLPADLTQLPRSEAGLQVKVTVAGVTGQCSGSCDVTYDASLNSEVTEVNAEIDEASGDATVTVTGTRLGTAAENIRVMLTGALVTRSCAVTAAADTEVTCTARNMQAGIYTATLTVTDKGLASGSGEVSVSPRLVSVTPAEGSPLGGTVITLRGQRLPHSAAGWVAGQVTVGDATCRVINSTSTATSCRIEGTVGAADTAVAVTATFGDWSAALDAAFTPLANNAVITALNVSSSAATGGGILGITGTGFGRLRADQSVTVGGASCDVTSWRDTEISCRLPPLSHGQHDVQVIAGQLGLADNSAVAPISYTFKVSDVSPRLVSAMGGSVMRIRGEGLAADCGRLNITAGDNFTCDTLTCTDTEVTCRLQRRRHRHVIRNNATHPRYGVGYLWQPQELSVAPGDLVTWSWAPGQVRSGAVGFAVHQTPNQHSDEYDQMGFNSGDKTDRGSFTTMVEDIGTIFYSGPPVGSNTLRMRGVIHVVAPPVGDNLVRVQVGMVEAQLEPTEAAVPNFEPTDMCSADSLPATCPAADDPVVLQSSDCATARVTGVTVTQGGQSGMLAVGDELTISGMGFSTTACHNRVTLGSGSCDVMAATANQLTCQVSAGGLPHGAGQPLGLTVANRGAAVIDVAAPLKYFRSEPTVSGVSPASGSPTGGTLLTLSGSSMRSALAENQPRVLVGTASCPIQSVTLSQLTCLTPAGTAETVPVKLLWQADDGQTRTLGNMTFTYDPAKIPTLTSAELSSDDQRTLTIAGDKLGTDATNIIIRLIPRTASRRRRQAEAPPAADTDDARPGSSDVTELDSDDVSELGSDNVMSLDSDVFDADPAVEAVLQEDAAFWRRFSGGSCNSFGEFASSGQLRAAGSGATAATAVTSPSAAPAGAEQDYLELTPEYVSAFHEAALGRHRARRRVHLRRRRRRSAPAPAPAPGNLTCGAVTIIDGGATCQLPVALSGEFDVQLLVGDLGVAADTIAVDVAPTVSTASLPPGSVQGGARIQLAGAGFGSDTSVTIGGEPCKLTAMTATTLECLTPPGEGAQPLVVTSAGLTADGPEYTYSAASTPVITSASSQDNSDVSLVSGEGTGLDTAAGAYLTVGSRLCDVTSLTDTQFSCELESHLPGGQHAVTFRAPAATGDSAPFALTVPLAVTSVSPATAGLSGTSLTIASGKFDTTDPISVTVCDEQCQVTSATSTQVTCLVPAVTAAPAAACDVILTLTGGASVASNAAFTYDASLTSSVTSVTPVKGGTAGGTTVTITGTNFAESGNTVTIDGVTCDVSSESVTQVVCVTNGHSGPGRFPVLVDVPGVGFAEAGADAMFQYVDRWSSPFTWGGADPPSDGQSVSITAGQTILLDTSTPVLRLILVDGGELIFDPDAAFLELNAEYIVVVGGGKVQIGTEESPHQGQAAITLHGHVRATELPVYGAKVLAVRNGTLDLHGRPLDITWTYLDTTAAAGDTSITLDRAVSWTVGDEIVIASTGDKRSMGESEKHVISAVSEDGLTLTLESPLVFEHISSEQTFAGQTVRMRAEVGLLTRNVKVRGSVNEEFTEQVQACAAGFNPGQFDVQTCFHGRYGAETITDQFGATVMIHAKYQNQHLVTGRIEYVEVTEAGQAFRLGRYPIHYHLNGNVTGSYVRGCAIHRTYNRAVTIHAVDYLLVEHNVAYDNMGHAFFTEDGIEAYNTIQYNLAVFTRTSSSLLNVDVTPASFWVVNPTNIVRHNAAAGGTHFGFWYRTEEHPSGPSFTDSYCPNHAPMGEFFNNSAHSFGRYGLWVFSMDGYFPLSGGENTCSGEPDVARFGQFLAWRCERGAEVVFGGALRFENFTVVDNEKSGLEMVKVKGPFGHDGPGVQNALVVGRSTLAGDACTERGIITPKQYIFNVDGATFVNFDGECSALGGCSQCKPLQGGFHHQFRRIVYDNAPNRMKWKWTHESLFHDTDGSLAGEEDGVVLPWTDILPPEHCTKGLAGFDMNPEVPTAVCDSSVSIHRMAFNRPTPSSLLYKSVNFTTQHGTTSSFWMKKRLTHANGWMALLVGGETHKLEFANSDQLTNISYFADFYFLRPEDRLAVSQAMLQRPDRLKAGGAPSNGSGPPLDFTSGAHGDIHWDNDTYTMSYLVAGQSRARRAAGPFDDRDKGRTQRVELKVERCFFEGCLPPPVPTVPTGRPDQVQLWSQQTEDVWTVPGQMQDVTIPADLWVLVDVSLPPIRRLIIYGVLEIGDDMDNVLNCTHIVVYGKLVAGTAEQPFQSRLTILLRGRHRLGSDAATADIPMPAGTPNVGWKALATFGGLELYGSPHSVQWTSLSAPAAAGDDSLQLASAVDWPVGVEVVVTTGSFESRETEVRRVTAVSNDGAQLTLNETLQYGHLATEVALPGGITKPMAAKVGLLSRNIRIEGESYDDVIEESFGARVLASSYYDESNVKKTASVRLSNVEFRLAGQDGWSDSYDPRYALALHSLDDTDATVVNCSFNHLFSPAVGIFYSNNVTVQGSVIMHTVGSGIIDEGSRNRLENNLVSWLVFPGTYNSRDEPENLSWDAAFRVDKAKNLTLIGNVAAGSERIGFHIGGTDCSAQSSWSDNEAHGVLHGVHMFSKIKQEQCAKVSGFYVWRAWDFGIYFHVPSNSVVVDNNVLVENTMSILPMLYKPNPVAHEYADKQINITNTVVVAVATAEHCDADTAPAIAAFRSLARAPRASGGGRTGIVWGQFLAGKVGAPKKPWHNPMSYPGVRGNTYMSSVQLVNFNRLCGGRRDIAVSTLVGGDDAQHPAIIDTVTFTNVNSEDRLFLHRPNVARVNPSDCVDMDCDGHKHAMLIDTDGSIIGSAGTLVPQAEFEFDGDQRRGVGYYRVPESAVTRLDGSRIPYADKMPNKGIWRSSDCTWQEPWRAYSCPGGQQRMLVIESMDPDTEVRRVSPIALIADPGSSGFVDLLNGPQDMGWCFGYTCQERISTFYSVVAPGRVYEMHFTGTPPQHLRFHFLNAEPDQAIVMKIWYPKTQRYDVYYEGEFIYPANTEPGTFNIIQSDNPQEFVPLVTSTKHGENYFSRTEGFLHVLVRGPGVVEIKQQPIIVLKMGFVAEDDFFESDVLSRLADLLDIDASQLRVANIVREDSTRRRRRRRQAASKTEVEFEIGAAPATNTSTNNTTAMSIEELKETQAKAVNEFQTGKMDKALGVPVEDIKMTDPEPPATDPTGGVRATNTTGGEDLSGVEGAKTYTEQQREREQEEAAAEADAAGGVNYERPSEMALNSSAVSGTVQELTRLTPLIKLYMKDANGAPMSAVGHASSPWQVQAELVSPPSGVSLLNTRMPFEAGVATFSRLIVSGVGSGLRLRFRVVQPADTNFSVDMTGTFATEKKQLVAQVVGNLGDVWHNQGDRISPGIRVEIRDPVTGGLASAAALRGYTWKFHAALYQFAENTPNAALQGTRMVELPPPSGGSSYDPAVRFDNLKITLSGSYYVINFTITTPDDPSINLQTLGGPIRVRSALQANLPVAHTIGLKMTSDFSTVSDRKLPFYAELVDFLSRYGSQIISVTLRPGSIRITADTRDSSEENHRQTVEKLRRDLDKGLTMTDSGGRSYPFDGSLLVDGVDMREKRGHHRMPPWMLALICIMATLLFVGSLVLIWICCCNTVQRGKVQDVNHMAFKVPINAVPPPPFTPGVVNSFNIRMSIVDRNQKVAPSVIQVTSDDPLVNMEDMKVDDMSVPSSPLVGGSPAPESGSEPTSEPEPEETEEQRRQREANEALERAEKEAEEKRRAEQAEADRLAQEEAARLEAERKEEEEQAAKAAEAMGGFF